MILSCSTCEHRWISDELESCPVCILSDDLDRLRGACRPVLPYAKALELPHAYEPPHPAALALPDPPEGVIAGALRALRGVIDVMSNQPRGARRRRGMALVGPPRCSYCSKPMELVAGSRSWVCPRDGMTAGVMFTWRAGTVDAALRALESSGDVVVVDGRAEPAREVVDMPALPQGEDDAD
jgi:hypothetical protein